MLLFAGLWTPVAGAVVALIEVSQIRRVDEDPGVCLLSAAIASGLAMLGPGRWSNDARLFGWRAHLAPERKTSFARGLSPGAPRPKGSPHATIPSRRNTPIQSSNQRGMSVGMRPKGGCGCPCRRPESPKTGRALAMLAIDESVADRPDLQGAYFDGSLELLRELTVTTDLDAALPPLSAIANKMLPHDALRMACFDQRGQLVVNAATADVPDLTTSDGEDVIIDDVWTRALGASAAPHAAERLVGAGYRSALGMSTRDLVRSVSGFSAELGVRTMAKGRVAVPVVAVAFAVLFFGLEVTSGPGPASTHSWNWRPSAPPSWPMSSVSSRPKWACCL